MFTLTDDYRFTTEVRLRMQALQTTFTVECRMLPSDELERLQKAVAERTMTPEQFTQAWLTGWPEGQVQDATGQPVPYSAQALARLLQVPGMPKAMVEAYYRGFDEAAEGNSGPPPAGC